MQLLEVSKAIQPGGQYIWPLVKPGISEIHPEFRGSDYTIGASFQDSRMYVISRCRCIVDEHMYMYIPECTYKVVEQSKNLFLCIGCATISWNSPIAYTIVLDQFCHST